MPQRASVGDAEALRDDSGPLEADAGQARVMLGRRWAKKG